MIFDWYNCFSKTDFLALSLLSKTYTVDLEGIGEESFTVYNQNYLSVAFRDVFIPLEFSDDNPTVREGDEANYALYLDADDNVWIGIEVEDE